MYHEKLREYLVFFVMINSKTFGSNSNFSDWETWKVHIDWQWRTTEKCLPMRAIFRLSSSISSAIGIAPSDIAGDCQNNRIATEERCLEVKFTCFQLNQLPSEPFP